MTSGKQASNNYPPSFNRINDFLVIPSYIRLPWYLQNLIMLVCSVAYTKYRSSHPEVFCEKGVLINFAKFTGKHLRQSLFFNKVAGACIFYILIKNFCIKSSHLQVLCSFLGKLRKTFRKTNIAKYFFSKTRNFTARVFPFNFYEIFQCISALTFRTLKKLKGEQYFFSNGSFSKWSETLLM